MPKAGKKIIIWVVILAAILLAAVLYYSFSRNSSAGTAFLSDGYYLEVGGDDTVQRVYFAGGDTYRARYPEGFRFADVQGTATDAAADTFLHYNNDAIGSFSDGIVIDLETLGQSGFTPYYRLGAGSVLLRADNGAYEVEGASGTASIGAALYKLSDTRYLIGSDRLTLQLSAGNTVEAEGYVEVTYIDSSVIRLVSADGVYYTVASDAEVITPAGIRCCLADKRVRDGADNVLLKLSEVLLDTDSAIEVLPSEDVEWVVPRFDITTVDGDDGTSGENGIEGEQGAEGVSGTDGVEGTSGTSGTSGASGASGSAGATGGTAGSSGEEGIVMPDFLLTDFSVSDTGFTGELTVTDSDDLLRDDDSYNSIYLVELATGRETLVESTFRSATDTFSFLSAVNGSIELSGLKTDTRYRLVVRSSYEANSVTFQRVFISKEFSTDSMGLELKTAYATEVSGTVRLTKKDYSSAEGARLVLYQKSDFVSSASEDERLAAVDLDRTDLLLSGNTE